MQQAIFTLCLIISNLMFALHVQADLEALASGTQTETTKEESAGENTEGKKVGVTSEVKDSKSVPTQEPNLDNTNLANSSVPTEVAKTMPKLEVADQAGTSVLLSLNIPTLAALEISQRINNYLGVRANIGASFSIKDERIIDNNTLAAQVNFGNNMLLLDYRPFAGSFFLAGGVVKQNYNITANGSSTQKFTFNNVEYQGGDIGTANFNTGFSKETAPYLGFGWTNRYNNQAGLAYGLEIGVFDVGNVVTDLNVICGNVLSAKCAELQENVRTSENTINSETQQSLADLGLNSVMFPVISFSLGYTF